MNHNYDGINDIACSVNSDGNISIISRCASLLMVPLLTRLREYDTLRITLEENGGDTNAVQQIIDVLRKPIALSNAGDHDNPALTDQVKLKGLIAQLGYGNIFLDIRKQLHGLPVYYLCRVSHDYWSEYSLIIEDLYISPGYPLVDERFAKLMNMGHESYFMRMSSFRDKLKSQIKINAYDVDYNFDNYLYQMGRYCFGSMWHEDQRPAFAAAKNFGLTQFQQAIELLYLCLSADLCELRSHTTNEMVGFFEDIYPQPSIHTLLEKLPLVEGTELNQLPKLAIQLFKRLNNAFQTFMETEVSPNHLLYHPLQTIMVNETKMPPIARNTKKIPLYKLVFGNFYQLDILASILHRDERFKKAAGKLEKEAKQIIAEIIKPLAVSINTVKFERNYEKAD
jgi:hypothetical protein